MFHFKRLLKRKKAQLEADSIVVMGVDTAYELKLEQFRQGQPGPCKLMRVPRVVKKYSRIWISH